MAQITGVPPLNGERATLGEARPVLKSALSIERTEGNRRLPTLQAAPCPALEFREVRERGQLVCIVRMEVSHG